jgi:hypothetical protein
MLLFQVPDATQKYLRSRNMKVQNIYNAHGDFNLDSYSLYISKLPVSLFGSDPYKLMTYLRVNFNDFIDKDIAQFNPYAPIDESKWYS